MSEADRVMGIDIGGTGVKAALVDTAKRRAGDGTRAPAHAAAGDAGGGHGNHQGVAAATANGAAPCRLRLPRPGQERPGPARAQPRSRHGSAMTWPAGSRPSCKRPERGHRQRRRRRRDWQSSEFGAGKGVAGTVLVVTLGTGIGSAVFRDGVLLPDTELGHLEMRGKAAEKRAAASIRARANALSWKKWGKPAQRLPGPRRVPAGSRSVHPGWRGQQAARDGSFPHLKDVGCRVEAARLGNGAGIIGAAMFPSRTLNAAIGRGVRAAAALGPRP